MPIITAKSVWWRQDTPTHEDTMMHVTIELPDTLTKHLQARWADIPRHLLERLALDAYAEESLTTREVQDLLGLEDRFAVYTLCRHVYPGGLAA